LRRKASFVLAACVPLALIVALVSLGLSQLVGARAWHSTCKATGFSWHGVALTAAIVNPSTVVTGVVDATGCDVGVFFGSGVTGTVLNADIYGALDFGVLNVGATVTIKQSHIHDIGDVHLSDVHVGVGIYFADDSHACGTIEGNTISHYLRSGVIIAGPSDSAVISNNTLLGLGPVSFVVQTGIEVVGGAHVSLSDNHIASNIYVGTQSGVASGIAIVGGSCYHQPLTIGLVLRSNILEDNDIGIWISELDAGSSNQDLCVASRTPARIQVLSNKISNSRVLNASGASGEAYQAGITVQGRGDIIVGNIICGAGYLTTHALVAGYIYPIDLALASDLQLGSNTLCGNTALNLSLSLGTAPLFESHLLVDLVL
jgi:hypothetical protein